MHLIVKLPYLRNVPTYEDQVFISLHEMRKKKLEHKEGYNIFRYIIRRQLLQIYDETPNSI